MIAKKLIALAALFAMAAAGPAPGATDIAAAGQGNATISIAGTTCSAPMALTLNVRSNTAVVTEAWGPGGAQLPCGFMPLFGQYAAHTVPHPPVKQCVDGAGISTGTGYTLSQSGQTYTVQGTYRLCNNRNVVEKLVVQVQPARLVYSHT